MASPSSRSRARALAGVAAALLVLVLAHATVASAQADGDAERRALRLVYEGRCDEALSEIDAARREEDSARLARLEGQCRIRLKDYPAAVAALDDARRMDPGLEDVDVFRGVALFQLADFDGARAALLAARGHTSPASEPQLELYTGLVRLQANEPRDAAESLERARLLDAGQVEPVASFYAGLAWQTVGERELAREALLRVTAVDPDGPWGRRAEELLAGRTLEQRSWASIMAGIEYDSNVVLLGEAVPLPQGISGESDWRATWFLEGGAELFRKGRFSGGLAATYAGNAQFTLSDFDIEYPRGSTWLDFDIDPDHLLRARYGIGYAWVDYSPFLFTQDATISLFRNWGRPGNTEIGVGWLWNDYKYFIVPVPQGFPPPGGGPGTTCPPGDPFNRPCAPFGVESARSRNRDGNAIRPFLQHRYRVFGLDGDNLHDVELRGGYGYQRYWAHGNDWDYQSHDFLVGAKATLVWDLAFDLQLGFSYRPFTYPSSYPTPPTQNNTEYPLSLEPRLDEIVTLGTSFEKPIDEHFSVSARYLYTRAISNVAVFDYSRHIVGAYVKYRF